ncbi:18968_t:CDS:2, partial [Funneliformis geosporum]
KMCHLNPTLSIAKLSENFLLALIDGKIIVYEVPLSPHGAIAGKIAVLIHSWNNQLVGASVEDRIVGRIETIPSLHGLSTGCFSSRTTIQIYIAIKLFFKRQDGAKIFLQILLIFHFSTTACNAPGIPNYQLHIPAGELFNGSLSGVPAGTITWIYGNYKI